MFLETTNSIMDQVDSQVRERAVDLPVESERDKRQEKVLNF